MSDGFAYKYAQALYDVCQSDPKLLEKTCFDLKRVEEVLKTYTGVVLYFDSPLVELERKLKFFARIAKVLGISEEAHGLMRAVIKRNRFFHLDIIIKAYDEFLEQIDKGVEAVIYSASPLTETEHALIKSRLETVSGKLLATATKIDKSLIGGIRAEIGHKVYDASIKNSLKHLKEKMVGTAG